MLSQTSKMKNYNTHKKVAATLWCGNKILKHQQQPTKLLIFLFVLSHSPSKINTFRIKFVLIMFQIKIICVYLSQIVFSLKFLNKSFNNFDHTQYFHCFVGLALAQEIKKKIEYNHEIILE